MTTMTPELAATPPKVPALGQPLTGRQREVLALIARGVTDAEIAAQLYVTEATASTHARRVRAKLGARTNAHVVHLAWKRGLLGGAS